MKLLKKSTKNQPDNIKDFQMMSYFSIHFLTNMTSCHLTLSSSELFYIHRICLIPNVWEVKGVSILDLEASLLLM